MQAHVETVCARFAFQPSRPHNNEDDGKIVNIVESTTQPALLLYVRRTPCFGMVHSFYAMVLIIIELPAASVDDATDSHESRAAAIRMTEKNEPSKRSLQLHRSHPAVPGRAVANMREINFNYFPWWLFSVAVMLVLVSGERGQRTHSGLHDNVTHIPGSIIGWQGLGKY